MANRLTGKTVAQSARSKMPVRSDGCTGRISALAEFTGS